jgi:ribosomal protein S18 acetylase RimI-like enzyme
MSERETIPLTPVMLLSHVSPVFAEICQWPFADPYIVRLLKNDIPQRDRFGMGALWAYRNPSGEYVGFGTTDICKDYAAFTGGLAHPYIPLLAVNPSMTGRGFGTLIVQHLISQASWLSRGRQDCSDVLFLDVYADNAKAIRLYVSCGFTTLTTQPIPDPEEGGRPYIVMGKRV